MPPQALDSLRMHPYRGELPLIVGGFKSRHSPHGKSWDILIGCPGTSLFVAELEAFGHAAFAGSGSGFGLDAAGLAVFVGVEINSRMTSPVLRSTTVPYRVLTSLHMRVRFHPQ